MRQNRATYQLGRDTEKKAPNALLYGKAFFLQGIAIWFALRYNAFCEKSPAKHLGPLSRIGSIEGLVLRPVSGLAEM